MAANITVALAGNPNCGKTTMFNALTGARQRVGNYPGITVERKEGSYQLNDLEVQLIDLPGTYSLTAYSLEELVARNVLVDERPDVVVDIVDATALERSLYLAVQFMELGVPLVLALNMMDEVKKKGIRINTAKISELLQVPVVETIARQGQGKKEVIEEAVVFGKESGHVWKPLEISYGPDIDGVLAKMTGKISAADFMTDRYPARWIALKYLEGDEKIIETGQQTGELSHTLEQMAARVEEICERNYKSYPEAIIADYRYGFINSVLKQPDVLVTESRQRFDQSDRVDKVLTHKLVGPIIMVVMLYGIFQLTFTLGEYPMGWLEAFFGWLGAAFTKILPQGLLQSLVVSGIIDGVGSVMSFVPLILIMFLSVTFLEDLGYMARVAYMLDRVFRIFGLHGASVMPFIIAGGLPGGCAVPGVMAARTLRSPKERLATIITAPFQVCGAKIPVFLLLVGAFFQRSQALVMFLITVGAWTATLLVSRLLRWTVIKGASTPFVMELPPYRLPTLRGVMIHTWERSWQYIKKAGTIILTIAILLWAAMTFPQLPTSQVAQFEHRQAAEQEVATVAAQRGLPEADQEKMLEEKTADIEARQGEAALEHSVAGRLGHALSPVMSLAGFNWQTNIALIGGFAAKEVIVATLGTAYSLGEVDPEEAGNLSTRIAADPHWTLPAVLALIIFVLLYAPCFVTVVAMAREATWKWALFAVAFNTVLAYGLAVLVFQVGSMI